MTKRYGGAYSPQDEATSATPPPENPFRGKRPARSRARVNLLFAAPLPLAIVAFFRPADQMALSLLAVAVLLAAAWMTREGVAAEAAFDARSVARRPRLPRKIIASGLLGTGLILAGLASTSQLGTSLLFGALGVALHLLSFGIDPLASKGAQGIDAFQQDRVARVVDEGEKYLAQMRDAILRAEDRDLVRRIEHFQSVARRLFRTVEEDPRDLSAARKFMGVYLMGARDATIKFADLYGRARDEVARVSYETLLDDLEHNFAARTEKLLQNNAGDLDVEIEVLRERLAREGV
jgi:hypothetical protein